MAWKKTRQKGRNSLVARLNTRLFLRLAGIFLCMDLLLAALCALGVVFWSSVPSAGSPFCIEIGTTADPTSHIRSIIHAAQDPQRLAGSCSRRWTSGNTETSP